MEEYVVDFSGVTDKESFHACLKKSLPLPEWYGENLDALYDSLTELDDACIYFKNCGQAAASLADYYNSFLNVIADAQMEVQGLFCFLEDKPRLTKTTYFSTVGFFQARNNRHQKTFSTAVFSANYRKTSFLNFKAHVL